MPKSSKNSKKNTARKIKDLSKKNKKKLGSSAKSSQTELPDSYQFLDYKINYIPGPADASFTDGSSSSQFSTSNKQTACYFKEFGDFWPYLGTMKLPELVRNKRFCFMLNNPQYLRKENRLYLENLRKRHEVPPQKREAIEESKPIDVKEIERNERNRAEKEFHKAEDEMKRDFPNYFEYLKSYYDRKRRSSLGNKDNKEFKEVILRSIKQNRDYLNGMEQLFQSYSSAFI